MDRDYYSDPRRRVRTAVARALARPIRHLGFELEVRSFYSPIPDVKTINSRVWSCPSSLPGVRHLDTDAQLRYVEDELICYIREFRPSRSPPDGRFDFYLANGLYQGGDADILYAMVRRHRPRRIVEIGAGFSTLVTASACAANAADGDMTEFISYDPHATAPPFGLEGLTDVRPLAAEDVPLSEFESLQTGDILFIDSSHTVRVGGDVSRLLLEVIPRLASGVLIHLHDIFLPWQYPRDWIANGWYWSEQYLLQALLVGNDALEVVIAAFALFQAREPQLRRLIPNIDVAHPPLSFWMRRTDASDEHPPK